MSEGGGEGKALCTQVDFDLSRGGHVFEVGGDWIKAYVFRTRYNAAIRGREAYEAKLKELGEFNRKANEETHQLQISWRDEARDCREAEAKLDKLREAVAKYLQPGSDVTELMAALEETKPGG